MMIVKTILQILSLLICLSLAPPLAPNITIVSFAGGASFSVEWSESAEVIDGIDFYIVPDELNCTGDSVTVSTCQYSTAHLGQTYNFTVLTYNNTPNCGTQQSEATVTVNLQGMCINIYFSVTRKYTLQRSVFTQYLFVKNFLRYQINKI